MARMQKKYFTLFNSSIQLGLFKPKGNTSEKFYIPIVIVNSNNLFSEKSLQQINFKCKYKFYKKVKITMTNLIYKRKKNNICGIG